MLEEKILNDFKQAMKDKDKLRVSTLSFLRAQLKNVAIEKKSEKVDDADVAATIRKQIKQREDSIEKFKSANRQDLAGAEERELGILKSYLPSEIPQDELIKIVEDIIIEAQAKDMKDMGRVMKEAKIKVGDRADNKTLSSIIKERLERII